MPFLSEDTAAGGLTPQLPNDIPAPKPDFIRETLPAAFNLFNTVGAVTNAVRLGPREPADPAYDPFRDINGYEDHADAFIRADTPGDVAWIKRKIDRENHARETLSAAGWEGVAAGLAAGLVDPVNLIPVGGSVYQAGRLGYSVARSAAAGAKAGLLTGAAQEALLYGLQETRTAGEGVADVAVTTLLAGALGAAAPLVRAGFGSLREGAAVGRGRPVPREVYRPAHADSEAGGRPAATHPGDLAVRAERDLVAPPPGADPLEPGFLKINEAAPPGAAVSGGSVGAKAVRDTTLAEETLKSALGLEKAVSFQDPVLRTVTSPSVETRRVIQELAETPLYFEKNATGIASPIAATTRIKMWEAPLARAVQGLDDLFVRYRLRRDRRLGDVSRIALGDLLRQRGEGTLDYQGFRQAVGKAMRRGDASDIPEVAEAARLMRKEIFDPLKDKAISAGLLPEEVKPDTAASYLTRIYDVPRIVARRPEFEGRLVAWLRDARQQSGARLREFEAATGKHEADFISLDAEHANVEGEHRLAEASWQDLRRGVVAAERDLVAARREARQAGWELSAATRRLGRFRPSPDLERGDPLADVLRDLRRGGPPKPASLSEWVRKQGGLRDDGGEARALGLGDAQLINGRSGMSLEDAARRAQEAGYFTSRADDANLSVDEFLWAVRDDAGGQARLFRDGDLEALAYLDYLGEFGRRLDELGLDLGMSNARIKTTLEAAMAGKDGHFREATSAAKAKAREIEFYHRRAAERQSAAKERLTAAEGRLAEVKLRRDAAKVETSANSAKLANLEGELRKLRAARDQTAKAFESEKAFAGLEDIELADVATQITDRIIGASPARSFYEPVPLTRGPLRERTLSISDYAIEDFLEADAETVARIYTRTMAADVELASAFGRADMQDQLDKIAADYAKLRVGVTDEVQLGALDKRMRADLRDVSAVRDRVRGSYALPADPSGLIVRAGRVVRNWNYARLMGGMTLTSIPDAGRTVTVHGLERVVRDGLVPLVKNLRGYRMAAEEAQLAGTALDMVLDTRAMQLSEVWDDYGRLSKFERGVQSLASNYGLVSLMAPWNAAGKQFAAVVTQSRLLRAAEAMAGHARSLDPKEGEYMAMLGIDTTMAGRIATEFSRHGERQHGGVMLANTSVWADREAVDAFRAALIKDVDRIIATPGQDKPLWMSTELGKTVGQFKSFSMASTQRVALAALQQRDAAALNGVVLSVGLGMLSYAASSAAAGRDPSDDPLVWLGEGFDRSGLLFWLTDVNSMGGKVLGLGGSSRYASRSATEALLGPTLGAGLDTSLRVAGAAGRGDWQEGDTRALRRLVPWQNLFYLRRLFDAAEEGINEALGVPTGRG